jgi:hypothetical protein
VIIAIVVNHKVKEKEKEVETKERQTENKKVREHNLIYFYEITCQVTMSINYDVS